MTGRGRKALDGLAEDLRDHLAQEIEDNIARGMTPEEARRQAHLSLGNLALVEEDTRAVWAWRWLEDLRRDLAYALRSFRRTPGFAAVVIVTLALGIGANTAVFSLLDAVMLRALPVRDPGSLVEMVWKYPGDPAMDLFRWEDYQRIRANSHVFSAVIGVVGRQLPVAFDGIHPVPVQTDVVTGTFLPELDVRPVLGRSIGLSDDTVANAGVAMISWRIWNARFQLDPDVLGRRIVVNNAPATIIGVAPEAFAGIAPGIRTDVWVPFSLLPRIAPQILFPAGAGLSVIARLKPGASLDQARAEMRMLDRPRIEDLARRDPVWRTVAVDVQLAGTGLSTLRDQFRAPIVILMGTVGLLLLIACVNLAGLQLSRGIARRREMAVRVALGAGRGRLVRQLLTEGALLSIVGAVIALDLALFGSRALLQLIAAGRGPMPGWPAVLEIQVGRDVRVLLFTGAIALFTTILFGSAAAWPSLGPRPLAALGDRIIGARSRLRTGNGLVIAQIALSIALLSTAGFFVRHLSDLRNVDLGFDRQSVLLMKLAPRDGSTNPAQLSAEYRNLLERLRAMPGVRSASLSAVTPIQLGAASHFVRVEGVAEQEEKRRRMMENWVSPDYFATFHTPLVAGRDFALTDDSGHPVAIVNEAMARHYFSIGPITSALGRYLTLDGSPRRYEIVAVVGNAKYMDLHDPAPPTVYFDAFQEHVGASFAVRTVGSPTVFAGDALRAAEEIAKSARVGQVTTLADQVDESIVPERVTAALAVVFGGVGAVLAALGVYGLLAFTIARRTNEIGIRMAIGATRGDILRMVLTDALLLALAGVVAGVPMAVWAGRVAASVVPHLGIRWLGAVGPAALGLSCIALVAASIPALRASRLQPMEALRHL